jgi:hypothetical protein
MAEYSVWLGGVEVGTYDDEDSAKQGASEYLKDMMSPVSEEVEVDKTTELPYEGMIIGTESEVVKNKFGSGECTLNPVAVAVYDVIQGAELMGLYGEMQKGMQWFRKNYPEEYMILLD